MLQDPAAFLQKKKKALSDESVKIGNSYKADLDDMINKGVSLSRTKQLLI